MNRFVTSSLGAIFLTAALAGTSHAAMPAAAMSPVDRALAADHNPRFIIETLDEIEKHDIKLDISARCHPPALRRGDCRPQSARTRFSARSFYPRTWN